VTGHGYGRPVLLTAEHDCSLFDCGNEILNQWLRERALTNQATRGSRTFVVTKDGRVVAYYSLSNFAIRRRAAPARIGRNMPDPVPAVLLGSLAVDHGHQGIGLGKGLLRDAILRVVHVAEESAVRALVVHAIDQAAYRFYANYGFEPARTDPMELMILVDDLRHTLGL
jgi:predicted N-acetyltransferase YhbS